MNKQTLRDILLAALAVPSSGHGDLPPQIDKLRPRRPETDAAVLIPVIDHPGGPTILLTRRAETLADHAGQVSLPGGRIEAGDEGPVAAALRETEEEVGLPRDHIEVLGTLSPYLTITCYRVIPVLACVRPGFTLTPDVLEVAEVFEVPLATLRDPAARQRRRRSVMGVEVGYWAYETDSRLIWGATAAILVDLCLRLDKVTNGVR